MKTTLEIPEPVMRRAKARAAATGQTLTRLVTQALTEKLAKPAAHSRKPWMRFAGVFKKDKARPPAHLVVSS